MYKTYTVKEFREQTRKVLNEALLGPVEITRYDDAFILSLKGYVPSRSTPVKKHENFITGSIETISGGGRAAGKSKLTVNDSDICPHGYSRAARMCKKGCR